MSNYHYTKAVHLASIVNEGKIRTTTITNDKKERPAAWLTKSDEWEVCCSAATLDSQGNTQSRLSVDEMKESFGVCRIKIKETLPTTNWAKFKYVGKVSASNYYLFDEFSRKRGGKPQLWNCSFKPITSDYFESIEMLVEDNWVVWDKSVSIEQFIDICHSCNSRNKLPETNVFPLAVINQMNFFKEKQEEIIDAWLENKAEKGYLEIHVKEDYYNCQIKFIKKNISMVEFNQIVKNEKVDYLYLHLLWHETKTHYKAAFAYDPINKMLIFQDLESVA